MPTYIRACNMATFLCMAVGGDIWVAVLHVSPATAVKISAKHGFASDEVRLALVCREGLECAWDDDPERGQRALIRTSIRGVDVLAVLYPVESVFGDEFHLGSVYRR